MRRSVTLSNSARERLAVRLFVGNLPYGATEAELREHLSAVAVPTQIMMPVDRETGRPRGFAFVEMPGKQASLAAIAGLNGKELAGRPLKVNEAQERSGGGGRGGGRDRGGRY